MLKYFCKAFINHWNLLFLGTAAAFGMISGSADIVLPLAAAIDIVCISFAATRPGFQAAIDAGGDGSGKAQMDSVRVQNLLAELSPEDCRKFKELKQVCTHFLRMGKQAADDSELEGIADVQISGLNRLLWIYLKLLHSKNGLEQFFRTIDRKEIQSQIQRISKRLSDMESAEGDDLETAKKRESLTETLHISETRLANYDKVRTHYEFIILESERLRAKTAGLAEMAFSQQDLNAVISDVDATAFSVQQTSEAINELASFTGVSFNEEAPVTLL